MLKTLYRKSRWLHKYLGLLLSLFFMWMSISGIILNHPHLVADISVPHWFIPPAYKIKNWNRSSLIGLVYSKRRPEVLYAYGKKGVWKSPDGGKTFVPMSNGFPKSRYYLKTNHLYLWDGDTPFLLAATEGGLYRAFLKTESWQKIPLPFEGEAIKKILYVHKAFLIFSESHVYRAAFPAAQLRFETLDLRRAGVQNRVTLVKMFFDLHDGRVWGLPGRLLVDLVGLILFFMSFSGFYIWFNPWRWRKQRKMGKNWQHNKQPKIRLLRTLVAYHLKIGIYVALFFLILGGTAFFMRPPFLAAIADGSISSRFYPGKVPSNVWHKKIQNALFDAKHDRIVIAANDGLWQGRADASQPFERVRYNVPIFVMGPTYFECIDSVYLIGSFNGLYAFNPDSNRSINLLTGKMVRTYSNIRPGKLMITGYFRLPTGEAVIATHKKGLLALKDKRPLHKFALPEVLNKEYTLSLWNYMFELHNGRIFQDVIGGLYILIAPLGSFLFLIITLTGIFDWVYIKFRSFKMGEPMQMNYIGLRRSEYEKEK